MKVNYLNILLLLGIYVFSEVYAVNILTSIKKAVQETKCGLHTLGNKIYHHEHAHDPCKDDQVTNSNDFEENSVDEKDITDNKSDQGSPHTQSTVSSSTSPPEIDIRAGDIEDQQNSTPSIQGRRINVGANCPKGYRADKYGMCRLEY